MKSAFTMLELVFSIVIIGVLSSIALIHIPAQRLHACIVHKLAKDKQIDTLKTQINTKMFMTGKDYLTIAKEMGIPSNQIEKHDGSKFNPSTYSYFNGYTITYSYDTTCANLLYKKLSYEDLYKIDKLGDANARSKLPKKEQHFYPNEPSPDWIKNNKDRI